MATLKDISSRLRKLRSEFDLTQQQVAEFTGVSYKYYQRLESGRGHHIWLDTVERFARLYHLELWQLLHPDFLKYARKPRLR
ncbi:MAG: helix-turn-helix transcriptional regulator [Nitrospira sp.]|mgnify:FL=1|nr:helix-turn-helix transcriptional regulator [Nitrospira sp.]